MSTGFRQFWRVNNTLDIWALSWSSIIFSLVMTSTICYAFESVANSIKRFLFKEKLGEYIYLVFYVVVHFLMSLFGIYTNGFLTSY